MAPTHLLKLSKTPLFAGVPHEALATLAARATSRRYRPGTAVFVEGERGSTCFTILAGRVKIATTTHEGRESVVAILGPGEMFGDLALFDDAPRSATATTLGPAELLILDGEDVRTTVNEHPVLGWSLLAVLASRLRGTNRLVQSSTSDVLARVARVIADLATTHGSPVDGAILLDAKLTQADLAGMVGASRESVARAIRFLRGRGWIASQGHRMLVRDMDALRIRGDS